MRLSPLRALRRRLAARFAPISRRGGWVLGLGLAWAWAATGCEFSRPDASEAFTPEEQRLIRESVELMRLKIERARDPQRADELGHELGPLLDETLLQAQLERLATDPARGKRVLDAIHDSLQAMRGEIFPPTQGEVEDGQAVPRVGERAEPDGPGGAPDS